MGTPDPPGVCLSLPGDFCDPLLRIHQEFPPCRGTRTSSPSSPTADRLAGYREVELYGDTDRGEFRIGSHRLLVVART
ncbi:hypothetical protein [Kutzneria kofuensis]|uniref:hypothetical protein n=1 Tax=Kutzneria kofuensis TaxID=103725 RepID=UPI0031E7B503